MSVLKSRSRCSLVILTQTFFLGIENLGQGETDCLPSPAAANQQARRITPYKNVTSCPKFKSRSLNYQCYVSLVLLNCTMAFALHTVTESSELQESCAFKIQGPSKNWSGPDPTDPTGSAGPAYMCDPIKRLLHNNWHSDRHSQEQNSQMRKIS